MRKFNLITTIFFVGWVSLVTALWTWTAGWGQETRTPVARGTEPPIRVR